MNWLHAALALMLAGCATVDEPRRETAPPPAPVTAPAEAVPPGPPAATEVPAAAAPAPESAPAIAVPSVETYAELAAVNSERLIDVFPGMSREVVDRLLDVQRDGRALNPHRQEVLRDRIGRAYRVLYYLTRAPAKGRGVRDLDLTPVIFRDDVVVTIGRYPVKKLKRGDCIERTKGTDCR